VESRGTVDTAKVDMNFSKRLAALKPFPIDADGDDAETHRLVSAEAGMHGSVVALWAVFFVYAMGVWIARVDTEAALAFSLLLLFLFAFVTTCVWWVYRDMLMKRLKNHTV
jgi:Flp pilus assembly protein TadB